MNIQKTLMPKKIISVYNLYINHKNDKTSENIICPDCKNLTFLNFGDDNINNCKNNHEKECSNEYKSITQFMKNQIIDENEIKCSICNNSKNLYGDNFYICSCQKKLCQLCNDKHEKNGKHTSLNFDRRYTICNQHLTQFTSYCLNCNINLCQICEIDHENHKNKIILFKKEIPNEKRKNEIINEINLLLSNIMQYKKEINELKDLFNFFINNLNEDIDSYKNLYYKLFIIINNLKNYQNIKNILNYKNTYLNKDINNFLNDSIKNKIKINYLKIYLKFQ